MLPPEHRVTLPDPCRLEIDKLRATASLEFQDIKVADGLANRRRSRARQPRGKEILQRWSARRPHFAMFGAVATDQRASTNERDQAFNNTGAC
jgi:hypothetical protein